MTATYRQHVKGKGPCSLSNPSAVHSKVGLLKVQKSVSILKRATRAWQSIPLDSSGCSGLGYRKCWPASHQAPNTTVRSLGGVTRQGKDLLSVAGIHFHPRRDNLHLYPVACHMELSPGARRLNRDRRTYQCLKAPPLVLRQNRQSNPPKHQVLQKVEIHVSHVGLQIRMRSQAQLQRDPQELFLRLM